MGISMLRAAIMYIFIVAIMRIMGKRQLGDLQSHELVITFLISGIAAIPLQENSLPLLNSIVAICVLAALEIVISVLNIKVPFLRRLFIGHSITIIRDGNLDLMQLKRLRVSFSELMDELRVNGAFNLEDVQYASIETNGKLSVLLKPGKRIPTADQFLEPERWEQSKLPCLIIDDGTYNVNGLTVTRLTKKDIDKELKKRRMTIHDVLIMTADADKNYYIVTQPKSRLHQYNDKGKGDSI